MKCIELTRGQVAIVDDADFEMLAQWRWYTHSQGYACRKIYIPETQGSKTIYMHKQIMGEVPKGFEIDHVNGSKVDNRRENLRFATRAQNTANRPAMKNNRLGVKGVGWRTHAKKFCAKIMVNGKSVWLGYFDTVEEAKMAYELAASKYYAEFANNRSLS